MGEARLVEILGSLSLATDLAAGLPAETAVRTSLLAVRLARLSGAQGFEPTDAYYTGLLRFLGCSAYSFELAQRFAAGDDLSLLRELTYANGRRPAEVVKGAIRGINRAAPIAKRATAFVRLATSPGAGHELGTSHCELAVLLARRLGMSEGVVASLGESYEHWDGRGAPSGLRGDGIRKTSRVVQVAWRLAAHFALGGADEALRGAAERRGTELDPALVDCATREAAALFADLGTTRAWEAFLEAEPRPAARVSGPARTLEIARVFADFSDVKSPWTVAHSRRVASVAVAAAKGGDADPALLELAGLLHDVGRVAIPNGLWDKPGALDARERERVRGHTFETERVLARAPIFTDVAALASMAHERLDGDGYHRGLRGAALSREARILAAADVYVALTSDRPHRAARGRAEAAKEMARDAHDGKLGAEAVDAVLAAEGHARGRRAALPEALTAREVEIVRWVARGLGNKEIAARAGLSASTVKRHLENVFAKVGLRTRAAISVWALTNDLID